MYSDKPPLCCCIECRTFLWRRHTEGVLSLCLHLSAPYIFWVGWIGVREKLGGLVVWLNNTKARATLTCGMDLFSVCLQSLLCSEFVITAWGRGPQIALSLPHSLFWIGLCVCVCVHSYLCVPMCMCIFVWGFDVCPMFALPALEPVVPPISALISMLLGRKRKSGIAGSCRVVINFEMISALPKAWAFNQYNMLALIFLPSLLSWLVS